ncbi:MAG: phosphoribosyl-ATP diphosphatase, partial [Pseudomonadota bacterium]
PLTASMIASTASSPNFSAHFSGPFESSFAVKGDRAALTSEAADVLYHLLVMLAARDVTLDDVLAELERREGTSGIAEKAAR